MARSKRRPTRLSQGIVRKQRPALDIGESATSNAHKVAGDLESFLRRGLPEGETLPDMALVQIILGNIVTSDAATMVAGDEAHFKAVSNVNTLRLERNKITERLYQLLCKLRDTWDASFGVDSCQRILGLGINLPSESLRVQRLGERVVDAFSDPGYKFPEAISDAPGVVAESWLTEVKPEVDALAAMMKLMSAGGREVERRFMDKGEFVDTYGESLLRSSHLLETIYKVSGNEELARRLRPTVRKAKAAAEADSGEGDGSKAEGSAPDQASAAAEAGGPSASASEPGASDAGDSDSDAAPDRPPAGGQAAQGDGAQPSQTASAGP